MKRFLLITLSIINFQLLISLSASASDFAGAQWIGAITRQEAKIPEGRLFQGSVLKESQSLWALVDTLSRRSIILRRDFLPTKAVRKATAYICGLGFYELTINGQKVGDSEFAPLWSDYDKSIFYNTYDVTAHLSAPNTQHSKLKTKNIIHNSQRVCPPVRLLPKIQFEGFPDIHNVPGDELIETLATSYSHVGLDETLVVTRSNKRANIYNQGIRAQILGREDELCSGDRLMIVKNNYFWNINDNEDTKKHSPLDFIANGDMAIVRRVRHVHEQYGFRFAEVTMTFPDYDDYELTAMTLLDTLTSEAPALTRDQQEQLYNRVMEDYADIPHKADRLKKLKEDRYYNALQVKFAYAATCHKAQGGQWAHIYVDQGYMTDDMLTTDYLHWLYTAFTRATEQLFLVNWPKTQIYFLPLHP